MQRDGWAALIETGRAGERGEGPMVAGYVAVGVGAGPLELSRWREWLGDAAAGRGLVLGEVFFDVRGRVEGLHGLLRCLRGQGVAAVLVPDLGHLRHVRCLQMATGWEMAALLRRDLLTVRDEPESGPVPVRGLVMCGGGRDGVR
jgi:hypothetical protein